ncbi:hypothetical protein niasHT_005621 [Heterodera trifolii]|uniref:Mos1 transposase HTH domain-containing protein n=1 Tax=Heterodera trifolii TaxID=157864 RepID=A0ABD2MCE0_9BILA
MELEMPQSKLQMLTILRHYWKKGFCVSEAVAQMNAVEGTEFVDESTAKKWFMRFNNGDTSLKPRPRNVCDAVWFDVFGFLGNAKLGIYMEVISCHKWVFHWHNFTSLHFQQAKNGTGAELFVRQPLLLDSALTNKQFQCSIKTFNKLSIGFVDRTVIAFLHSIKHAFCPRFYFTVNIGIEQKQSWAIVMEQIWPLVPMSECYFRPTNGFPASLLDCAELRLISSFDHFPMTFPCVSNGADQSVEKAATNLALFNWLHVPRADGLPKVFNWSSFDVNQSIEHFKQKFVNDTSPATYIVVIPWACYHYQANVEHFNRFRDCAFTMENEQTQECLELRASRIVWLLVRRPNIQNWHPKLPDSEISEELACAGDFYLHFNDANIGL